MTDQRSEEEINRRANEKARKRKAARDRILATKTIEKGLLIVHTGKGKGKSTAAFGLVMRALGNGMKVGVVQYVKGKWQTGERGVLEKFPGQVEIRTMGEGFTWETQDRARDILAEVVEFLSSKPEMLHVIVTGRNAKPELVEAADLVTEMTMVKHPFRAGVKAQKGIEF